ncbi:hypothetical protein TWF718_002979 [Orbilia javanica]|uniref:F-box domain-containing protein n=1 Tax=Orbilia javanica TaxID=47235 RepID=A0AAN8NL82_9PEZI
METTTTTGILTLPNELLSKIIYDALYPSFQTSKARAAAQLAPVCRRFYELVMWHLYTHCYIQFQRYWIDGRLHYPIKFRGFGEDDSTGYRNASKRFENYKNHGKNVKVLTIRRLSNYIGCLGPSYFDAATHEPQMITQHFTTAFPNLKTITLNEIQNDPVQDIYILGSLENILTTLPNLKNLNLHFVITQTYSEELKVLVESQKYLDQEPTPSASAARLQAVKLDVHVRSPFYSDLGIGNWLLSALPPLLQPSFNTINTLTFTVTGHPDPAYAANLPVPAMTTYHPHGLNRNTLNPLNRRFSLSNLRCLKFSVRDDSDTVLTEFVSRESFENVEELEIRDAAHTSQDRVSFGNPMFNVEFL